MSELNADHKAVLRTIKARGGMTRAALSAETGWARGTVTQRLNELLETGWLVEDEPAGTRPERRGRPSTTYQLNPRGALVFVLALGQTQATVALTDMDGRPLTGRLIIFTPGREAKDANDTAKQARALLDASLREAGRCNDEVQLCVVGKPGPIDPKDPGAPTAMPGWLDVDIRDTVEVVLGVRTVIENDVNLMVLGYWDTNGRPDGSIVMVKAALGMGAGIILDGHLVRGRRGMAGEIGHLPVSVSSSELCACGHANCVGNAVGTTYVLRSLREQGVDVTTVSDLNDCVGRGDPLAVAAVRQAGRNIGEALVGLVATVAPDVVIIGGPLSRLGDHLVTGARETLYARSVPALTAGMRVVGAPNHREYYVKGAAVIATEALIDRGMPLRSSAAGGAHARIEEDSAVAPTSAA